MNEKLIKEINRAHSSFITNLRYYLDASNQRELILSVCGEQCDVKIWDTNDYKNIKKIQNIYKNGVINS